MEKIIGGIIFFALLRLGLKYLFDLSEKNLPKQDGKFILRADKMYIYLGLGGVCLSMLYILGPFFLFSIDTVFGWFLDYFFGIALVVMGFWLILWAIVSWVTYDELILTKRDMFGKLHIMRWVGVKEVLYSKNMGTLVLKDGKEKISIDVQYTGFRRFVKFLKQKLDPSLYEKALGKLKNHEETLIKNM